MAKYEGGGGGGGGGTVTSFNGRVGAVVPANGDYNSTQITNSSGVAGGTVTAALNTLLAITAVVVSNATPGIVPAITAANLPLVSNGTGTAASWTQINLAAISASGAVANQYPSWNGANWVPATPLPAPANPADNSKLPVATNGSYVYSFLADVNVSATAAIAGSKIAPQFGAQTLSVTGAGLLAIGTTPATTGTIRLAHATQVDGRNVAASNAHLWDWGVTTADTLTIGGSSSTAAIQVVSFGQLNLTAQGLTSAFTANDFVCAPARLTFALASIIRINPSGATAAQGVSLTLQGQVCSGTGATVGGHLSVIPGTGAVNGSLALFSAAGAGTTIFQGMGNGILVANRSSGPTGAPVAGFFLSSNTGFPEFETPAANILTLNLVPSAGAALVNATEFMSVTYNGNARKIPLI